MFGRKKKRDQGLPDLPANPNLAPSMNKDEFNLNQTGFPSEDDKIHELPSFPDSPMKQGFSQTAIKDAVSSPPPEYNDNMTNLPKIPDNPTENDIIEMEEWQPHPEHQFLPEPISSNVMEKHQNFPVSNQYTNKISDESNEINPPETGQSFDQSKEDFHSTALHTVSSDIPPSSTIHSMSQYRSRSNKPIFIKLEKVQSAHESIDKIEEKLDNINDTLKSIKDLKKKEDAELASWEKEIESVKSRIKTINSNIFDTSYS
jgi:hypothetical protein